MGSIRIYLNDDGKKRFYADVKRKKQPPLRGTFTSKTDALRWLRMVDVPIYNK